MEDIKQYLLTIVCASAICAIAIAVSEKNGIQTSVIKLLCAIFISITAISPWLDIKIYDLVSYYESMETDANSIIASSVQISESETRALIKKRIEEYIYDKAAILNSKINVDVILSDDKPYAPVKVLLNGPITPFNKQRLQQIISDELGIPGDKQEWN